MRLAKLALGACSLVPVVLVVSAPPAYSVAAAPTASSVAAPAVGVLPAGDLVPGQRVRVVARGLPPSTPVTVDTCLYRPDSDLGCHASPVDGLTTDVRGRLSLAMTVPGITYYGYYGTQPGYCRDDACRVMIYWRDADGVVVGVAESAPLVMRGSRATITATPASGLTDGQRVRVTGRAEGSDARYVAIVQLTCYDRLDERGCRSELPLLTVRLRPDDTFAATVRVGRMLPDGVDCAMLDDPERDRCLITARFLRRPGGVPDETFGVPSFGHPEATITFS
ncbi:MAG TPA: hypothetical protein VFT95_12485 [Micromonosporaceae bacterium]|nr:hypothetical protein [Micromonosporaceae bacterium]